MEIVSIIKKKAKYLCVFLCQAVVDKKSGNKLNISFNSNWTYLSHNDAIIFKTVKNHLYRYGFFKKKVCIELNTYNLESSPETISNDGKVAIHWIILGLNFITVMTYLVSGLVMFIQLCILDVKEFMLSNMASICSE